MISVFQSEEELNLWPLSNEAVSADSPGHHHHGNTTGRLQLTTVTAVHLICKK